MPLQRTADCGFVGKMAYIRSGYWAKWLKRERRVIGSLLRLLSILLDLSAALVGTLGMHRRLGWVDTRRRAAKPSSQNRPPPPHHILVLLRLQHELDEDLL